MRTALLLALSLCVPSLVQAGAIPRTVCTVFAGDLTPVYTATGHVARNGNRIYGTCVGTVDAPGPMTFDGPGTGLTYLCGYVETEHWAESIDRHGRATLTCAVP